MAYTVMQVVKESNCLYCNCWFVSDKHLSTGMCRSSTVSQANFTAAADKVHGHLVLNHIMQGNQSATTIKFAGDTDDDDTNTGIKTCFCHKQNKSCNSGSWNL